MTARFRRRSTSVVGRGFASQTTWDQEPAAARSRSFLPACARSTAAWELCRQFESPVLQEHWAADDDSVFVDDASDAEAVAVVE
jgi:hypothetical protein